MRGGALPGLQASDDSIVWLNQPTGRERVCVDAPYQIPGIHQGRACAGAGRNAEADYCLYTLFAATEGQGPHAVTGQQGRPHHRQGPDQVWAGKGACRKHGAAAMWLPGRAIFTQPTLVHQHERTHHTVNAVLNGMHGMRPAVHAGMRRRGRAPTPTSSPCPPPGAATWAGCTAATLSAGCTPSSASTSRRCSRRQQPHSRQHTPPSPWRDHVTCTWHC